MITDVIFTTPGAVLVLLNGGILGTPYFKTGAPWIMVSVVLFLVAAGIWLGVLVPQQRRMLEVAEAVAGPDGVPEQWFTHLQKWFRMGGIASLLMLVTLMLMVIKPGLW
jgi:uncharacterized membrane protein